MNRIGSIIIAAIEAVVYNNHGMIVIAEGTPTDIIISMMPVYPGRPPVSCRNPIPSESKSPVPSPVMMDTPTPRIVGNPVPSNYWVPNPPAIIVWPPC